MQHLETLWKVINAASTVKSLAVESKRFEFFVNGQVTVYLHAEHAEVMVTRWHKPQVEINAQLQAGFGWRILTDQDDAGVYLVATRRAVVGNLSRATFNLIIPANAHLTLKLDNSMLKLDDINGTIHVPPVDGEQTLNIEQSV